MNELQQVHNIVNIENIRGYVDPLNGVVFLNLEDVCIGLGFTQVARSGNISVRWERIERYFNDFRKRIFTKVYSRKYILSISHES